MNRKIPALYTLTVNITNEQKYSLNTNKVHLFIHIHSHTNTYLNPNRQSAEKFASFANHVLRHEKREGKTILLTPLDTTPARKSLTTGHSFHIHCRVDTTKQFIFIYNEASNISNRWTAKNRKNASTFLLSTVLSIFEFLTIFDETFRLVSLIRIRFSNCFSNF